MVLAVIVLAIALSERIRARVPPVLRVDQIIATMGGLPGATVLNAMTVVGFRLDGLAMICAGHALEVALPLAALPVA